MVKKKAAAALASPKSVSKSERKKKKKKDKEKTEQQLFDADLLKAEIEGNIGKCHVLLAEYEDAIPLLESSRKFPALPPLTDYITHKQTLFYLLLFLYSAVNILTFLENHRNFLSPCHTTKHI